MLSASAAHILARNTGSSADNLAALQLPHSSGMQPRVGKLGGRNPAKSVSAAELAGDLEMGTQLGAGSSDSENTDSHGAEGQRQQQQHSQQHSVLQRMSAAFSLGRLQRRQSTDGMSGNGSAGGRMQMQLSPVYSLGDEVDEAAALTEDTELLHDRA